MPQPLRNPDSAKLVGTLKFVLHPPSGDDQILFDELVHKLGGRQITFGKKLHKPGLLALDIKNEAEKTLGDKFTVTNIQVSKGSVIVAVLVGGYATYLGVSRYKSFIESVKLMGTHIESLFDKALRNSDDEPLSIIKVKQTWIPAIDEKKTTVAQQQIHLKQ